MTRKKRITLGAFAVALIVAVLWTAWGNTALELNTIAIDSHRLPAAFDGYRIVHISDLHNAQMGKDNKRLLELVREAKPDLIAITGDLIDSRKTDVEIALQFAAAAMEIAPCYYVTGNHEARGSAYKDLKAGLLAAGVVILSDEILRIDANGEAITLIGVNDPAFRPADFSGDSKTLIKEKLAALHSDGDTFTVLLSHRPELFSIYRESDVDLVLSGHAHGGQFRLPWIGGLAAPNQGLFPEYDAGLFTEGNTNMIVSRGIGNSLFPFRFYNRPEVIVIELHSAEN